MNNPTSLTNLGLSFGNCVSSLEAAQAAVDVARAKLAEASSSIGAASTGTGNDLLGEVMTICAVADTELETVINSATIAIDKIGEYIAVKGLG